MATKPWNLRNLNEALFTDHTGNTAIRTGIAGDILITGNVNIPGNVVVSSTPENPVHNHITEVGTSGILTTPYLPVQGELEIKDVEFTSKNRLKTSIYQTSFFNTFQYGKEPDVWDEFITNGGFSTHSVNISGVVMTVINLVGSSVIRQTKNVQRYIPGRTSTLSFSVRLTNSTVGIRRRFGLFDEFDGAYFEDSGDQYYCVIRSKTSGSVSEIRIPREQWNGDHMDGTGPSGITANPDAIQMFSIEYEWYGAGQVKFSYIISGKSFVIHTFNTANNSSVPWCSSPFLPIRMELTNVTGVSGTHSLYQGSNSIISEGQPEKLGIAQNVTSPITGTSLQLKDTFYPVLSIRAKLGMLRSIILPTFFQAATIDNTNIFYRVVRNCTLTGSIWNDMADPASFTQYDTSSTACSGGIVIDSGFIFGSSGATRIAVDQNTSYQLGRGSMGTVSDTLTIEVASTLANKSGVASMTWIEQR